MTPNCCMWELFIPGIESNFHQYCARWCPGSLLYWGNMGCLLWVQNLIYICFAVYVILWHKNLILRAYSFIEMKNLWIPGPAQIHIEATLVMWNCQDWLCRLDGWKITEWHPINLQGYKSHAIHTRTFITKWVDVLLLHFRKSQEWI